LDWRLSWLAGHGVGESILWDSEGGDGGGGKRERALSFLKKQPAGCADSGLGMAGRSGWCEGGGASRGAVAVAVAVA
jgi:hypothetical protein